MNPRSVTIAGLSGFVLVVGMGLAALKSSTVLWSTAATTVVLALLLTAVAGGIFLRGTDRAYWIGFALFGWAYVLLANGTGLGGQFGSDLTRGFGDIAEQVVPLEVTPTTAATQDAMELLARRSIRLGNFVQIGRLLLALLFAIAGGLVARSFAARAEGTRSQP